MKIRAIFYNLIRMRKMPDNIIYPRREYKKDIDIIEYLFVIAIIPIS